MDTHVSPHTPHASPRSARVKRLILIGSSLIASYALTYFIGYFHGRSAVTALEQQNRSLSENARKSRDEATHALNEAHKQVRILESIRSLHQAIFALDARNFGIAQQAIKESAAHLMAAHVEGPLLSLAKSLDGYRLIATEDLGAQRQKLMTLVSEFDQLQKSH